MPVWKELIEQRPNHSIHDKFQKKARDKGNQVALSLFIKYKECLAFTGLSSDDNIIDLHNLAALPEYLLNGH